MKAITPEEMIRVLRVASKSKRSHAMILLAFRYGMRASEVCGLKLADVDFKNSSITIRRLKGSLTTTAPLYPHAGQPLMSVSRVLKAWMNERPYDGSDYVFTSQKGGKLDRTAFFRVFQSTAERAGLPKEKRHPHCAKHALGFALVSQNVNLSMVKLALGHKSIASTAVYAVPTEEQVGKAVQSAMLSLF
jgi:integrase